MADTEEFSVFPSTRSRFGSVTAFAFDALTVLSEPIHRRSLANARTAIEERQAFELANQAGLRQLHDRLPAPAAIAERNSRRALA